MQFLFPIKTIFPFPLATAKLIGDNFCRQATWAGGRYDNPMLEVTLSPQSWNYELGYTFISAFTAPMIFSNEYAKRTKKSVKSKLSSVRLAYSGSVLRCANLLVQLLFWSLRFLRSFAFRLFLLYGCSSILVILVTQSFQLFSGRCGH